MSILLCLIRCVEVVLVSHCFMYQGYVIILDVDGKIKKEVPYRTFEQCKHLDISGYSVLVNMLTPIKGTLITHPFLHSFHLSIPP